MGKLTRFSRKSDGIPSRHVNIPRESHYNPTKFQKAANVAFYEGVIFESQNEKDNYSERK